ncbi:MAG: hypothetical protein AAGC67_00725 [Myxococcota bacterium]
MDGVTEVSAALAGFAAVLLQIGGSVPALVVVVDLWPAHPEAIDRSAVLCPRFLSGLLLWLTVLRQANPSDTPSAGRVEPTRLPRRRGTRDPNGRRKG